uniref:AP2-like ethylene-responsive transcription factor n=1 Tax=Aegilops tauschii TaxID=37682 RepID=M8BPZ3_AEGTA
MLTERSGRIAGTGGRGGSRRTCGTRTAGTSRRTRRASKFTSLSIYEEELKEMEGQSREEYIGSLRRKSSGFSRGVSKYRGVARHHHNGRWEARIGRVFGNKYLYLGTYAKPQNTSSQ